MSKLPQYELAQRNPSTVLETLKRVIEVGNGRSAIIDVYDSYYDHKLEEVFLQAMDMIYSHGGGDPQIVIDTVYDVRQPPSPSKCRVIYFYSNLLTRR